MSWEAAVATAAMALVLTAAALVRGARDPHRVPWTLPAACAWAAGAALAGLWLWSPYGAWPDWYTFAWLPALVGVLVPAPRRWAVLGIATVAGTAAALVTWGAAVEGRLGLAERDVQGLGRAADPRAVSLLERLGTAPPAPPPRTAGELYAWWLASPLAIDDYPASLAVWTRAGEPEAEIRLATMDLPPSLVAALVRSPETARGPRVERLDRSPGVHYVLVLPLGGAGADVLIVGVGPRTRLIPAARVARFLEGAAPVEPPYDITLSPPAPPPAAASARVIWTRRGWAARRGGRAISSSARRCATRRPPPERWSPTAPPQSRGPSWSWATGSTRTCGYSETVCWPARAPRCWASSAWSIRCSPRTRSCGWRSGTSSSSPMTVARPGARFASAIWLCARSHRGSRRFWRPRSCSMTSGCGSSRKTSRSCSSSRRWPGSWPPYTSRASPRAAWRAPSPRCARPPARSGAALRCPRSRQGRRASSSR